MDFAAWRDEHVLGHARADPHSAVNSAAMAMALHDAHFGTNEAAHWASAEPGARAHSAAMAAQQRQPQGQQPQLRTEEEPACLEWCNQVRTPTISRHLPRHLLPSHAFSHAILLRLEWCHQWTCQQPNCFLCEGCDGPETDTEAIIDPNDNRLEMVCLAPLSPRRPRQEFTHCLVATRTMPPSRCLLRCSVRLPRVCPRMCPPPHRSSTAGRAAYASSCTSNRPPPPRSYSRRWRARRRTRRRRQRPLRPLLTCRRRRRPSLLGLLSSHRRRPRRRCRLRALPPLTKMRPGARTAASIRTWRRRHPHRPSRSRQLGACLPCSPRLLSPNLDGSRLIDCSPPYLH